MIISFRKRRPQGPEGPQVLKKGVLAFEVNYSLLLLGRQGLELLRGDLLQGLRSEVAVALDPEAEASADALELAQAEVAELLLVTVDQAEEGVLAVELGRVPGPGPGRVEAAWALDFRESIKKIATFSP